MERSAFEQKARTWREKALNVSRHYGAGEDMAEDIAQDVMLRLWQMHDELERFRSVEARTGGKGKRGMAHNETTATAHHATHLIIYAPRGTTEPRRDCPTIGYRNDISKHAPGKGKTNTIGRNKTEE